MINEELKKEENRKKFRELVMKYHPDKGGDAEAMKKLNASRVSDAAFEALIKELAEKKSEQNPKLKTSLEYKKELWKIANQQEEWIKEFNYKDLTGDPRVILNPAGYYVDFRLLIKKGEYHQTLNVSHSEKMNKENFLKTVKEMIVKYS